MREASAQIAELLQAGVDAETFPMAAAFVARPGVGSWRAYVGGATETTRWDLASLTKPMATVSIALRGVAEGWLDLDGRLQVPAVPAATRLCVRDVLGHRSGLPAWADLAAAADQRARGWSAGDRSARGAVAALLNETCMGAEPGEVVYSDLGFILLGWHLEGAGGLTLRQRVAGFRGVVGAEPAERPTFASTGWCGRRERETVGEVDDVNCWVLGGAAGHAGLFATLDDVARWATDLLAASTSDDAHGRAIRHFWSLERRAEGSTWVLGWDTPSPGSSSAGCLVEPGAIGHLGFTGTSVWIEREAPLITVLLTNRVAAPRPATSAAAIKSFRPLLHDGVRRILGRL